ncbi:MAG: acyl carrier protein [Clostridiales bacterium]|jgi:acyl carrier protein|nr:acyl carrier protein [Clostridiales bacterium]
MGLNMYETVKKILIDDLQIEDSEIKPESELINDLGINSLELADLVMNCEDKLGIEIKDEEIRDFVTVSDVVAYLEKTVSAKDSAKKGRR